MRSVSTSNTLSFIWQYVNSYFATNHNAGMFFIDIQEDIWYINKRSDSLLVWRVIMINLRRLILSLCICSFIMGCGKAENTKEGKISITKPVISQQDSVQLKDSHLVTAQAYITDKKYEDAVVELNEAIRLDPKDPASYYTLGSVYEMMGKNKESVETFIMAIKLDPYSTKKIGTGTTGSLSITNLTEQDLSTNTVGK